MSTGTSQSVDADAVTVIATTLLPWGRLPSVHVVDVGPQAGGAFEVAGPRTRPVRPHLELAMSPAGLAARVVQGDGTIAPLVVHEGDVIALPSGPLDVAARSDGVWALYRDGLLDHDRRGAVRRKVALSGISLVGDAADSAWLLGSDQAWHVEAAGAVHGPFPWRDPFTSFAASGRLCARERGDARSLVCLSPDGARTDRAMSVELAPLEHPVVLDGERMVTRQGTTVRVRLRSQVVAEATLQVAGLDTVGTGFVITAKASEVALWRAPTANAPLVPRWFATSGPGSVASAAVDGDTVTLYGLGSATTYRGQTPPAAPVVIDEAAYRATIFPVAWNMTPLESITVRSDGTIVVAASGPAGAALIELRMPAR